jgi:hypothetical protein
MHRQEPLKKIEDMDAACLANDVVTISELRRRFSKDYAAILRAGKIRRETDYYLIQGLLVDQAAEISNEDRDRLDELVQVYELGLVQNASRRTRRP